MASRQAPQSRSGDGMPALGLGSWMLTSHTRDAIERALELGYRMIDTSGDYHTQNGIGHAIRASGIPRDGSARRSQRTLSALQKLDYL